MKTSKIISMIACAALMVSSCVKDELSKENAGRQKPEVSIEQNNVNNYFMAFTITTDYPAAQFGYVVMDGSAETVPSVQDILLDQVGTALQSGVYSTANQTKAKVDFECEPDADYIVYAAAITDTGLFSDLVSCPIHVNDTEIPEIVNATVNGSSLILTFSEDIVLNSEGSATLSYIKFGEYVITPEQPLPLEYITVDGNQATFACPRPGNGAGYIVSFSYGLFEDVHGNKAYGVKSSFNLSTGKETNLVWAEQPVDFIVSDSWFKSAPASSWHEEGAVVEIEFPFDIYKNAVSNAVSVVYNESAGKEYAYADFTIENKRVVKVVLPRAPKSTFDIHFDKAAIYDEWGNVNTEYELPAESFKFAAYELSCGDYTVESNKIVNSKKNTFNIKFEYNTATVVDMSADWFNINRDVLKGTDNVMPKLRGVVDYEARTITFDGQWYYRGVLDSNLAFGNAFYYYGKDESKMLVFWAGGNGSDPIVVNFDENGVMTTISGFEYAIHSASTLGYLESYDYVTSGSALTPVGK